MSQEAKDNVPKDANQIATLTALATTLYNQGNYDESIIWWKLLINISPNSKASYYYGLGLCFSKLDLHREAQTAFAEAARLDPTESTYHSALDRYVVTHDADKTPRVFKETIKPSSSKITLQDEEAKGAAIKARAVTSYNSGCYDESIGWWNLLIQLHPREEEANSHHNVGKCFNKLSNQMKAREDFTKATLSAPHNTEYLYTKAREAFTKASFLAPHNTEYLCDLGRCLVSLKEYEEALSVFQRAKALAPANAYVYCSLGICFRELKQYDSAIAELKEATRLEPANAYVHYSLGICFRELKQYASAIAELKEATRLEPSEAPYLHSLGMCFRKSGKYIDAIQTAHKVLKLNSNNTDYVSELGCSINDWGASYAICGRYADARAVFMLVQHVDPKNVESHHNLGICLDNLGRYTEALAAFREAIRLDPSDRLHSKDQADNLEVVLGGTTELSDTA